MKLIKIDRPELIRHFLSILFFYFSFNKIFVLWAYGMDPYKRYMTQLGLPSIVSIYIIVVLIIEILFSFGVWYKKLFSRAIVLVSMMIIGGIVMSIISLIYKINSDCGCGLLGTNEYGLIAQKLLLLAGMVYLYKSKQKIYK